MTDFLFDGPENAGTTILLAHGAGAPMDSASMTAVAKALADVGFRVTRFEFGYMAARRATGPKPPPRADTLNPEYLAAIRALNAKGKLIIGGKSMGGRVASMVADEAKVAGLICLGYPFHPPEKPPRGREAALRTAHLADLKTPTLIVQGTRDPFGTRDEVAAYKLSRAIEILWLEDGDHDLKPRKKLSGFSAADHLKTMAERVAAWNRSLKG